MEHSLPSEPQPLSRDEFLALWALWQLRGEGDYYIRTLRKITEEASLLTVGTVSQEAVRAGLYSLMHAGLISTSLPWWIKQDCRSNMLFSLRAGQETIERLLSPRLAALTSPPGPRSRNSL